tara:strand:+ start:3695 stop:4483 length:789 start_codon:yes stop_codon:yes gene_type:complete
MIISTNGSGLGNRIKALVSCMRLSDNVGVYWIKNRDLCCNFGDLFLNDIEVGSVPPGTATYCSWRLAVLPEDNIPEDFTRASRVKSDGGHFSFTDPCGRNIDIEYNRIPQSVRETYCKYFQQLQIQPDILQEVETFSRNFDENTVSIHVRSWADDDERNGAFHRVENFIKEAKKFDKGTSFYLTSDSDYVKEKFIEAFGERVMIYDRKTSIKNSRLNPAGIKEDFIEMLLLSKNSYIIGTYLSTYTEAAWWLGGATAQVVVC